MHGRRPTPTARLHPAAVRGGTALDLDEQDGYTRR